MNAAIAEWCGQQLKRAAKILYLPGGPIQIGKCEADAYAGYDVIITRCKLADLDNRDLMACLWRLGYEFAAPDCRLLLEIEGRKEATRDYDVYGKMSNIGWSRWHTLPPSEVDVFMRVQRLAPWFPTSVVRQMSPNIVPIGEAERE